MLPRMMCFATLSVLLLSASPLTAATWRVELNGSGDFTDIQPAVNAAAAGDTIQIGPGRFATFRPCVAPAWTEETVVWVTKDDLTFIGSGRDETIVGPTSYYGALEDNPMGFTSLLSESKGVIRDLTIENIETGVYLASGQFKIENCRIAGDGYGFKGIFTWANGGSIRNCRFETNVGGSGCIVGSGARDIEISDCEFFGWGSGIQAVGGSQNTAVTRCEFDRSYRGVVFFQQATGAVTDCRLMHIQESGIWLDDYCAANVERVTASGGERGIYVGAGSQFAGVNVVVESTAIESLLFCCNAVVTLNNSHILPSSGRAVRCFASWTNVHTLDLTGNYWGTTDAEVISELIWDAVDEPAINCTVQFEPFANGPVRAESTSWGDLKARFR